MNEPNDPLSDIGRKVNGLMIQAKAIIKSSMGGLKGIVGVTMLEEHDTWATFQYCRRQFLVQCLWKVKDNEGIIRWTERTHNLDGSQSTKTFREMVFDNLGNVDKRELATGCGDINFQVIRERIESTKDVAYPFEPLVSGTAGKFEGIGMSR